MAKGKRQDTWSGDKFQMPDGTVYACHNMDSAEEVYIFVNDEDVYVAMIKDGNGSLSVLKYELGSLNGARSYAVGIRSRRVKGGDAFYPWHVANLAQLERMSPEELMALFPDTPNDDNLHTLLVSDDTDSLYNAIDFAAESEASDVRSSGYTASSNLPRLTPHMDPARYLKQLMDDE